MLYIVNTVQNINADDVKYRMFDTYSDSFMFVDQNILKDIISNNKAQVINANIQNGGIVLRDWGNGISLEISIGKMKYEHTGPRHIVLAKQNDGYKTVNYHGFTSILHREELKNTIKKGEVANCELIRTTTGDRIKTIDAYEIKTDKEFEKLIETKYNTFIAKTSMLGYGDLSFTYEIENSVVKLASYTGTSKDIILPPFITAIKTEAFHMKNIKTLKLNEGLKSIGILGFGTEGFGEISGGDLERVEIPSTVELVGLGAFFMRHKLFSKGAELNKDRFKVLNNNTIVLKQTYEM